MYVSFSISKKILHRPNNCATQSWDDEKVKSLIRSSQATLASKAMQKPAQALIKEESISQGQLSETESRDKNLKKEQVYINVQPNEDHIANKVSN